jgi:hypothetical protein
MQKERGRAVILGHPCPDFLHLALELQDDGLFPRASEHFHFLRG